MNGLVFLISFSPFLLMVYRKATYFCIMILYLAILTKVLMRSEFFGGVFRNF
jgi:hypothetical protein